MIYFIQSEKGGPIKIGYAGNVEHRLEQLQVAHAYKLVCLASIKGGKGIERRFHAKFEKYRLLGEWFEPCDELIELIENIDTFDPATLPEKSFFRNRYTPLDVNALVEELYAAALQNHWDYKTVTEKFKEEHYRHGYTVTITFKRLQWFEIKHKKRFEEKRAVTGLQLDV